MRLAKLISQRGLASRRKAEEMIAAGLVMVNGEVAVITTPVDPEHDAVTVRGKPLPGEPAKKYYLLNKPRGYITTRSDPQGRQSVLELIGGLPVRVEPVGRLDYDTEGALLLTNDGIMAHRLTHPSRGVAKVYVAKVDGHPTPEDLAAIEFGLPLDDGKTAPAKARFLGSVGDYARVQITVTEGRNRLIRRMMAYLGHHVVELRRESFAGVELAGLSLGETRELGEIEVARLREQAGTAV
ncbi:MAG: pseudouridine synthase [Dehalococcoidia bacterium]